MKKSTAFRQVRMPTALAARVTRVARTLVVGAFFAAALCSVGCDKSITSAGTAPPTLGVEVLFDPGSQSLPFPSDLVGRAPDGTLALAEDSSDRTDPTVALSTADGFSTTAPIVFPLGSAIDIASLQDPQVVRVFRAEVDAASGGRVRSLGDALRLGQDYVVTAGPRQLAVIPLRPLALSQGYVVVVTDRLRGADGGAAFPSTAFRLAIAQSALVDSRGKSTRPRFLDDATAAELEKLRQIFSPIADQLFERGIERPRIAALTAFTTRSALPTLEAMRDAAEDALQSGRLEAAVSTHPQPLFSTAALNPPDGPPVFGGTVDVYAAAVRLPLFVDAQAPLSTAFETRVGASPSRIDPMPQVQSEMAVPLLVALPNADSGWTKPASGWPVVIFQHGITGDRLQALAVVEAMAAAGQAVVAMDLPLHGLTQAPDQPFLALEASLNADVSGSVYSQSPAFASFFVRERTLGIDVVNNGTGDAGPDGVDDPSGTHFLNLQSLPTAADHARQAIADHFRLARAVRYIDVDGDGVGDINRGSVTFLGHSLGAIIGASTVAVDEHFAASALVAGGGGIWGILVGSPTFGPRVRSQLAAAGAPEGSAAFASFGVAAQTVFDAADPISVVPSRASRQPRVLVVAHVEGEANDRDQVVPEFVPGFPAAGTAALAKAFDADVLDASGRRSPAGLRAYWRIPGGDHGSLLDPSVDVDVTVALQQAIATFLSSAGTSTGTIAEDLVVPSAAFEGGAP